MSQIISRFRFRHQYFQSLQLEGFTLQASAATVPILRRYELELRHTQAGFSLIYLGDHAAARLSYLSQQYPELELCWYLYGDLNLFFAISDLPADQCSRFLFELPTTASVDAGAGKPNSLPLVASPISNQNLPDSALAILRCKFGQLQQAYLAQLDYDYEFQARKLHWIYYLINRSQISLQQARITRQDKVEFSEPILIQLETGEATLKFSALADFYRLQQSDQAIFDLQVAAVNLAEGQPRYQVLLRGLPTPDPRLLSLRPSPASSVMSSEMYVYI